MTSYRQIRYEQEGRVARLVLNRPKYRNAQSRILIEELDDAYARAGRDESVGAIVLMGEGDHFSARPRPWHAGRTGGPRGAAHRRGASQPVPALVGHEHRPDAALAQHP